MAGALAPSRRPIQTVALVYRPGIARTINRAINDRAAEYRNAPCFVYAVNGQVVFGAR